MVKLKLSLKFSFSWLELEGSKTNMESRRLG
jgi:hypothetical protein